MHPQLLAAGGCLAVAAAVLALRPPPDPVGRRASRGRLAAIARLHARSGAGRRLEGRLAHACIGLGPGEWRLAQVAVLPPLLAALWLLGLRPGMAVALAFGLTRLGGTALLWGRRHRLGRARAEAAPQLARLLAGELATGAGPGQAIESAQLAAPPDHLLRSLLTEAAARVRAGRAGGGALEAAVGVVRDPDGSVRNPDDLSAVAACFAQQAHHGASAAAGLRRVADGLEEEAQTRAAARATSSEVRIAAFSVPVVAAVAVVLLVGIAPGAWGSMLSAPGLLTLAMCLAAVTMGETTICRLTRV